MPDPTCQDCVARGPIEIDENARLRVEVITKYEDVIARLGARTETGYTHAISAMGLRFHYRIERPIHCALPDRTPHNEGLIVETACGLTMNIGHVCGDKWIFGLSKLVEMRSRTDAYDRDVRTIEHDPEVLRTEIAALEQAEQRLHEARNGLISFARPVSRYMRSAASDAKCLEVLIDVERRGVEGRIRREQVSHRLEGAALWGERPTASADGLRRRLDVIESEIREARAGDPEFNEVHSLLARRIRAVRRDMEPIQSWITSAAAFFTEANLRAVLYVTEVQPDVDEQGLIVIDEGVKKRISAAGVSNL